MSKVLMCFTAKLMMAESAVSAEPDENEENAIKDDQDDTDE